MNTLGLFEEALAAFFNCHQLPELMLEIRNKPSNKLGNAEKITNQINSCIKDSLCIQFSSTLRRDDIAIAIESISGCGSFLTSGDSTWLDRQFETLFETTEMFVGLKKSHISLATSLMLKLDLAFIIGWGISKLLKQGSDLDKIDRVISGIRPNYSSPINERTTYSDNHIHWSGSVCIHNALVGRLNQNTPSDQEQKFSEDLFELRSILNHILFEAGTRYPSRRSTWDWQTLNTKYSSDSGNKLHWLKKKVSGHILSRGYDLQSWTWIITTLWYVFQSPHTATLHRIMIYEFMQRWSRIRTSHLSNGIGLTRFTELPKATTNPTDSIMRSGNADLVFCGDSDTAEIKLHISSISKKLIHTINNGLIKNTDIPTAFPETYFGSREVLGPIKNSLIKTANSWHLCVCFSRSSNDSNKIWATATKFIESVKKEAQAEDLLSRGLKSRSIKNIYPLNLIRSIDVVGNENKAKIELFAPSIRWIQKKTEFHLGRRLVLSIHAGEDFAHPLSGMRHVDETIEFCQMMEGDRIGHALALGISIPDWALVNTTAVLSLEEHFDNLVWAWHQTNTLCHQVDIAARLLPRIERRILSLINGITWLQPQRHISTHNIEFRPDLNIRPTLIDLVEAWNFRRNCYAKLCDESIARTEISLLDVVAPDWRHLWPSSRSPSNAANLFKWRKDAGMKHPNPIVLIRSVLQSPSDGPQKISDTIWEDTESSIDLELYEAIQDAVIEKITRLGITIETNPTSNMALTTISSYSKHPIFRWAPPDLSLLVRQSKFNKFGIRSGPTMVTINTDDPGIIPTTLRNEYLNIECASIINGFSNKSTSEWIESIRRHGSKSFERNHIRTEG